MTTPNRTLYPLQTEEVQLDDNASDPLEGRMRYNGTSFRLTDATGAFNPRPSDAGVQPITVHTPQTTSTSWVTLQKFIFGGSDNWSTPQALKVIAKVASGTGAVRIQDLTNSLTIATNSSVTNTTEAVVNLGTIANVPTAEAIWAVQAQHPGAVAIDVESVLIDFFLVDGGGGGGTGFGFPGRITIIDEDTKVSAQGYYLKLYGPTEFPGIEIANLGTGGAGHPESISLSTDYTVVP